MDVRLLVVAYLMICILPVAPSPYRSRSKNRNSGPTYDQKQSGDYNIQLHLKDFEIVALLSDSMFASNGDYDYNYDYSELTIKPGLFPSTTTSKPTTSQATPTSQSETSEPTSVPSEQAASQIPEKSTAKPEQTTKILATETSEKPESVSSTAENVTNLQIVGTGSSTTRLDTELEANVTKDEPPKQTLVTSEIIVKPAEYMGIIEKDQLSQEEHLPLVVHRKCASGFTRDKQGRCRRVRRPAPQFSFGISRLATLASKLRQTNDAQASNETTE